MRYHSLRIIVTMYHFIGIVVIGCAVVIPLIMIASTLSVLDALPGATPAPALALSLLPALVTFAVGVVMGISAYAFGTLLEVIMDIEENTRGETYSIPVYREDAAPTAPKPWASFPPKPDERQAIRRGKWDMGK